MPGSVCSVSMCKSNAIISKKLGNNVRFFTFPKDAKLRREWVRRCFRPEKFNPTNKRICSNHFKPDDFEDAIEAKIQNRLPKILKRDCVPTLNLKPVKHLTAPEKNPITETKKTRLERAAKRKQKDFIKRILEEQEQDFESESYKSTSKQDMDPNYEPEVDEDPATGTTSKKVMTDKETYNRELERRVSQFISSKTRNQTSVRTLGGLRDSWNRNVLLNEFVRSGRGQVQILFAELL